MKEKISDLWNGRVFPYDEPSVDPERSKQILERIDSRRAALVVNLGEDERENLSKFEDTYGELIICERESAFIKVFSLAIKLVTEALE